MNRPSRTTRCATKATAPRALRGEKEIADEALRIARRAAILAVAALRDGDVAEARGVLTTAQEALDEHDKAVRS